MSDMKISSPKRYGMLVTVRLYATLYNLGIVKGFPHGHMTHFGREFKLQTERSKK